MMTLRLAWRNIFRNVRRTILTCTLIGFSLVALILTDGLILGMIEVMVGGITHTLAGEAQVHRKGFLDNFDVDLYLKDPAPITGALAQADSVAGYAPRTMAGGMVASTYNVTGALIYGVDAEMEIGVSRIRDAVNEGSYLTGASREILIGRPMAELLEVDIGDRIVLTSAAVDTGEIAQELFRLSGIFEFGPKEMDENFVFINLAEAQAFLSMGTSVHQIAVRFHNADDAKNRELPILKALTNDRVEALGWLDFNPQIGALIEMAQYSTLIVGMILFLLASLGVVNSMFMSIYERIYEFGVAKAIGTRPAQVLLLVLSEALFIALISCVFGALFAWGLGTYYAENGLPMGKVEFSGVVVDGNLYTKLAVYQFLNFPLYITLLTVVAAIYPAIFAARIVPHVALQRSL